MMYVVSKGRDHFSKWLRGWHDANGFMGGTTVQKAWKDALQAKKPVGCSWYAYGLLMSKFEQIGRNLEQMDDSEYVDILREKAAK